MKKIFVSMMMFLTSASVYGHDTSSDGALLERHCGIPVLKRYVYKAKGSTVTFSLSLMEADGATVYKCFSEEGAVLVGVFPRSGTVRAVIF